MCDRACIGHLDRNCSMRSPTRILIGTFNRPGAEITTLPERSARVDKQYLKPVRRPPVRQDARFAIASSLREVEHQR